MKIKKSSTIVSTLIVGLSIFSPFANAESLTDQVKKSSDIKVIKSYLENNVANLTNEFLTLKDTSKLDDVEKIIDTYYEEHPAPKQMDDPSISLEDVFPKLMAENEKAFKENKSVLNNFIEDQKENSDLGQVFTYQDGDKSKVDVYLGNTGEISIVEVRTVKEAPKQDTKIEPLYTQKETRVERTTGISYNALGYQMFTLWAEGGFKYNGTNVVSQNIDADWKRHFSGSTLNLMPEVMPKTRAVSIEGHKYVEVYARMRYEAGFGIRWATAVLNSGTVESYVGCSVDGSIYGGIKRVS
ncbi:hypothetical protein [Bacillus testis]|uniref:hypothetical protein n=1 Tax=Bacillus testis TaxID=1622072 RepID=UPI00067EA393|nr:hypothetical protein [Bacillus testis]